MYCVIGFGKSLGEMIEYLCCGGGMVKVIFVFFCDCMGMLLFVVDFVVLCVGVGIFVEFVCCGMFVVFVLFLYVVDNY